MLNQTPHMRSTPYTEKHHDEKKIKTKRKKTEKLGIGWGVYLLDWIGLN